MLRIFLTGGNGFIGKNILEKIGKKYIFYTPSSKELDLYNATAVESYFKTHKVDTVIHTAKIGGTRKDSNSSEVILANLRMFFNIVRCDKYFRKMIFLGSGGEYDKSYPIKVVTEDDFDKIVPTDNFYFYKYLCSKYIEMTEKIINLRLFGIYGKYEDYNVRFISNAICRNILELPITIEQNVFFDYLYIDDFIKILDYFIINDPNYKIYNVGTGKRVDLLSIAKMINKIANKKSKIIVKKKGLKNEYTSDNSRLLNEIGNFSFTDFEQSLKELYSWFQEIKPRLDPERFATK